MTGYYDMVGVPGEDPEALDSALRRSERPARSFPVGWEPGIAWDGSEGVLTTGPLDEAPDPALWAELIADWNLDAATTEVVQGSVQVRGWDANVGGGEIRRLRYYRATIRSRTAQGDRADIEALCSEISKRKPSKTVTETVTDISLVVPLSDWQIGKGEGGGSMATIDRIMSGLDAVAEKIRDMKRRKIAVASVVLVGMGDLVEQCDGHYAMQAFQTDLDRREQKRVARRLLLRAVDTVVDLVPLVVLAAVPGNHGENRRDGKAFTSWTDNDDLAVVEEVAEILNANPDRYGHVKTVLARDLTLVLNVSGINVGFAHGHQFGRGSGHAAAKAQKWWEGQIMGRQPIADADILVTGHLHHLVLAESAGRLHVQCPSQDGGSYWWTAQTGHHSPAGQLMFGVGTGYNGRSWGDLEVAG